jgi:amino acid transporter
VVLLLLLVFLSTNISVLVLRRDRVAADHFTAPVLLPVLAIASCLLLLWQQEASTWLWAGVMLLVGVALYLLAQAPWWRGDRSRTSEVSSVG